MINRFKTSIFYPSQIGKFAFDSIWRVILYIVIFATICTMPRVISVIKTNELKDSTISQIKTAVIENSDSIPNLKVENNALVGEGSAMFNVDMYGVTINDNKVSNVVSVVFEKERVSVCVSAMRMVSYSYNELGLDGFCFKNLTSLNGDMIEAYDKVIKASNYVIKDLKPVWATSLIISEYLVQMFYFAAMALIISFVFKIFSNCLTYGEVFKVTVYGLSIFELGNLISILFSWNFLEYICPAIAIYFIYKAVRVLEFNKMILQNIIKK